MQVLLGERVPVKIWSEDPDPNAVEQLYNVAKLPFVFKHVAAMPDVHWGIGATVGSVIATEGAVVPAAVGVDIGCGMMAWDTGLKVEDVQPRAAEIRQAIERRIPVGFNHHQTQLTLSALWLGWGEIAQSIGLDNAERLEPKARLQHGTLGGGNHFIELCADERGIVWAMLHSGSRGIGKQVADIYMRAAKEQCARHFVELPDKDLAYLVEGTPDFDAYISAVTWCQKYAWKNREIMMACVSASLADVGFNAPDAISPDSTVHCHHNYVTKENHFGRNVWLTRKGAVSARLGQRGIIPGSMGARSYIVDGLGNPDSFTSCSHGAGRKMGRKEAQRQFTLADLEEQTKGVECRKDKDVIDEIPGAYKDIDVVMSNQADLVKPVHQLKQFLCIKG